MALSSQVLLDSAFTSYEPGTAPDGFETEGSPITNVYGLHVVVYRRKGGDDYIFSFRGTEKPNTLAGLKDWANNFQDGWKQYDKEQRDISKRIDDIIRGNHYAKINLVGHSLGGALAQFAAYDFATRYGGLFNHRITLTTWNGLGGAWGLSSNRSDFDPTWMAGIEATHYFRQDDIVARLGGFHVGGRRVMLIDPTQRLEFFLTAHMKEELSESLNSDTLIERSPKYFPASKITRKIPGLLLAGLVNMLEPAIEGSGIGELIIGLDKLINPRHATVLISEVSAAALVIAFEYHLDFNTERSEFIKTRLLDTLHALKSNPIQLRAAVAGLLEATLAIADPSYHLNRPTTLKAAQFLSEFLQRAGATVADVAGDLAGLLNEASNALAEPIPGIPLGFDRLLLFNNAALFITKLGLHIYRKKIKEIFQEAQQRMASPLILDLDGDGIETLAVEEQVYFDHQGDGFAELSGWAAPDDGLLILDRNRNGGIDSGAELFGNNTPSLDGRTAANGFVALAELDTNLDGVIDNRDAGWNDLAIWKDINSNAILDDGETLTLAEAGIRQLNLDYSNGVDFDAAGNQHRQVGTYERTDAETRSMHDVWFATDPSQSMDLGVVEIDPALLALPEIEGMGKVPSLRQAMQRDTSGELRRLVERWYATPEAQRAQLIIPLLYRWTGVHDLPSNRIGQLDDQRKLRALEALVGTPYTNNLNIQTEEASYMLADLFTTICRHVTSLLNTKDTLFPFLQQVRMTWNSQEERMHWHPERAIQYLLQPDPQRSSPSYLRNLRGGLLALGETGEELLTIFKATILPSQQTEMLKLWTLVMDYAAIGTAASDVLVSPVSSAIAMSGGAGDDIIRGALRDDILDGGEGNDKLDGEEGHDIYLFRAAFGRDEIFERSSSGRDRDIVAFSDYTSSDITAVECLNGDLRLRFHQGDELTVRQYFSDAPLKLRIDQCRFQDGITWRQAEILSRAVIRGATAGDDRLGGYQGLVHIIDGLEGNDTIRGGDRHDQLFGNLGNDSLHGGHGDDWIRGGRGNDAMDGGGGQDIYSFARGDGQDTISAQAAMLDGDRGTLIFEEGIAPSDVSVSRDLDYTGLLLKIRSSTDQIRIKDFLRTGSPFHAYNPIQNVRFADGSSWDALELTRRAMVGGPADDVLDGTLLDDDIHGHGGHDQLFGWIGNDTLSGADGDDLLIGGQGNDILRGGTGSNRFLFNKGDGQDMIMADANFTGSSRTGLLHLESPILPEELRYRRSVNQLHITLNGSTDSVIIQEFFRDNNPLNAWNPITHIYFTSTGTFLAADQIAGRVSNVINGTAAANTLIGTADFEYLNGLAGNDSLDGREGDDCLDGGEGNDSLIGGAGNDLLQGGAGIDTASYATASGAVRVDLSLTTAQNTGSSGSDTLAAIENLTGGAGNDELRGNAGANTLDGGGGDDWLDGGSGNDSLWGGSHGAAGDTVSYASATAAVTVNLALTAAQATGGSGSDVLSGFENLSGSRFHDILTGSAGNNAVQGGEGNDQIWGSGGADRHSGGAGADQFLYRSAAEAGNGAEGRDWILDFQDDDRLDLSRIDANSSRSGDQAFAWIGTAAFSAPGQLRYSVTNGLGLLEGNTTGTGGAEFQLAIQGGFALRPGSHVLL